MLMEPTAVQWGEPLLQLSSYTFMRLVVDTVVDANGTTHAVFFIAAYKEGGNRGELASAS